MQFEKNLFDFTKNMETDQKRKVAIITGGASGLGLAMAKKFVENDIMSVLLGRDKKKLGEACKSLKKNTNCFACDLTQLDRLPEVVKELKEEYGRIDILINNAGIHLKKPMLEVTNEEFQQVILVNQTAVFCLTREVAKVMQDQGDGCILNISSMASQYGIPKVIAYTAAKSAVEGMTRAMAVELSPLGIRVNCIAPGFIRTPMSANALDSDPERKQKVLSRTPLGRLGTPEEIAEVAYFLASDAAAYITGAVLPIDGGNSIGF